MKVKLTEREMEILVYTAEGITIKEVADRLKISPNTAAMHRFNIYRKLGIKNAVELTHYALRMELVKLKEF